MKNSGLKIVLGSSSIFRRQIMEGFGYEFTVISPDIDEKAIRDENPDELVRKVTIQVYWVNLEH